MRSVDATSHHDRQRAWTAWAVEALEADATRSAETHLHTFPLPREWDIDLYLKDESVHPTGSLKHRLARSLILCALVDGNIVEGTPLVEASSGSTAVSEAYFARMLGLRFITVVPRTTSAEKIRQIEFYGGECRLVDDPLKVYFEASRIAHECDGHYLDQFTNAERATDWRGNNSIARSIFDQLVRERHPIPEWIVVGAGTGGTSATIGRYIRYQQHATQLAVVDPENSVFYDAWRTGDSTLTGTCGSRIEGIGRPRVELSFLPGVIDEMLRIPDAASIAGMRFLQEVTGHWSGPSTGTNLVGALELASRMRAAGRSGSIVTLICDTGARYASTYYDDHWVAAHGLDFGVHLDHLRHLLDGPEPAPRVHATELSALPLIRRYGDHYE